MEQRAMSHIEIKVLNAIRNRANFEKPLKAQTLRSEFDLNKRELEEVIDNRKVARAGDRQKFRDPLYKPQQDRVPYRHCCTSFLYTELL